MNTNDFRYQLRIKRAVLEAPVAAMSNTIDELEYLRDEGFSITKDDYRANEEAMFAKYWKHGLVAEHFRSMPGIALRVQLSA